MPRGERSQTWFPEIVSDLRASWQADMTWDAIIDLRKRLQQRLEQVLRSRGITPATVRCIHCGHVGPGAKPVISVRAVVLALQRFGIESEDSVRKLDKAWAKHRVQQHLDLRGEPVQHRSAADHVHAEEVVNERPN